MRGKIGYWIELVYVKYLNIVGKVETCEAVGYDLFGGETVSAAELAVMEKENVVEIADGFDSFSAADHAEYQAWIDSWDGSDEQ